MNPLAPLHRLVWTALLAAAVAAGAWIVAPIGPVPVSLQPLFVFLAGYALGSYALIENRFFSGLVRIQAERGHRVVSSGPYGWVRHPGYAGALFAHLGTPIFLGSRWALLPALLIAVAVVVRTSLEDKALQEELEGYHGYAERVRYRLLPGIW